jgi:predicted  nucleic acid-binding Zn-ribbon protein
MICDQCGAQMIWGGIHDGEECGKDWALIVNNHSCPECGVFVLEYIPGESHGQEEKTTQLQPSESIDQDNTGKSRVHGGPG